MKRSTSLAIILCFAFCVCRATFADDVVDLLGPPCGDQCADLMHPTPPTTQPTNSVLAPTVGESISAEWLDKILNGNILTKAATVLDFESAWMRGYQEGGVGYAIVDVTTKGVATLGGSAVAATTALALGELGPVGEAVAGSLGIVFADQLEKTLRSLPGFEAARQDIGRTINCRLKINQ